MTKPNFPNLINEIGHLRSKSNGEGTHREDVVGRNRGAPSFWTGGFESRIALKLFFENKVFLLKTNSNSHIVLNGHNGRAESEIGHTNHTRWK